MTSPKADNGTDPDLPRRKAKAAPKAVEVVGIYEVFDRDDWKIIKPNQIIANSALAASKGGPKADYGAINQFILGCIHPDQRDDFETAALADDTLNMDRLGDLMEDLMEMAYADEG